MAVAPMARPIAVIAPPTSATKPLTFVMWRPTAAIAPPISATMPPSSVTTSLPIVTSSPTNPGKRSGRW